MLDPGRRTLATTKPPGRIVSGTFGPTSTTRPKFSWPMTRKSSPGGAAPYSASLISLSVPSTPTRRTCTRTPLPPETSATLGSGISSRWIELRLPGVTAMAFMPRLSRQRALRYSRLGGPGRSSRGRACRCLARRSGVRVCGAGAEVPPLDPAGGPSLRLEPGDRRRGCTGDLARRHQWHRPLRGPLDHQDLDLSDPDEHRPDPRTARRPLGSVLVA